MTVRMQDYSCASFTTAEMTVLLEVVPHPGMPGLETPVSTALARRPEVRGLQRPRL